MDKEIRPIMKPSMINFNAEYEKNSSLDLINHSRNIQAN